MSDYYQPIRILGVKNVTEHSVSNTYGFVCSGMFWYIKERFNEAKQTGTHLFIDLTFIRKMQSQKGFDIIIFYNMLFTRDWFKISDPGNMQDIIYQSMLLSYQKFPKFLNKNDFKACVVKK